jgi:MFS family permease
VILPHWFRDLDTTGRFAFCTTYAGFSIVAMSVQLYAFILPSLLVEWHLTPRAAGVLAAANLAASAAGGWLAGALSDRTGRVKVLLVSLPWLVLSTGLCGLARNYEELLLARVLQGFAFGAEWAVGAVYISEIASPSARGRLVGTAQSAWAVGWGLAALISTVALALLPGDAGWRGAFFAGLPPAMLIFLARRRLVESSTFLAVPATDGWHGIFSTRLRGVTAKGCLLAIGTHGGYWAVATWWPTMLRLERGMSSNQVMAHMAALVGGSFVGYLLGAWLADFIGRRATLAAFALTGIGTVLFAILLPVSNAALMVCAIPLGISLMGLYSTVGPLLTELFPTRLRGSGMGFCYNVGRALAGAAPLAIGNSASRFGVAQSIGIYVCIAYTLVLLSVGFLRETRGADLRLAVPDAAVI